MPHAVLSLLYACAASPRPNLDPLARRADEVAYLYSASDHASAALARAVAERLWLLPRFDSSLDALPWRERVLATLRGRATRGEAALLRLAHFHRLDRLAVVLPRCVAEQAIARLSQRRDVSIQSQPTMLGVELSLSDRRITPRGSVASMPGAAL